MSYGLMFLTRKDGQPCVIVKAAIVKWSLDVDSADRAYTKIDTLDGHFQVVQETPQKILALYAAGS
jgi:hypothetical protein